MLRTILMLLGLLGACSAAAERPDRPEEFTPATAMLAIYGAYSTEHGGTLLPYRYTTQWDVHAAQTLATPLVVTTYREDGEDKAVLAVQLQDLNEGQTTAAHAEGAEVSVYVFRRAGQVWMFEKGKKAVTNIGAFGEAPPGQLVRLGPERHGLLFRGGDVHQGYGNNYGVLISLSEKRPVEALMLDMGEDDAGTCSDDAQERGDTPSLPPCWSHEVSLHFYTVPGISYFTLAAQDDGTVAQDDDPDIVQPVHVLQYYVFSEGQYRPAPEFQVGNAVEVPQARVMEAGRNQVEPRVNGAMPRSSR